MPSPTRAADVSEFVQEYAAGIGGAVIEVGRGLIQVLDLDNDGGASVH